MITALGEFVEIPAGNWSASLCVENGVNAILLVDDAQEPLLLKAISGQLYIKRLEPASAEAQ